MKIKTCTFLLLLVLLPVLVFAGQGNRDIVKKAPINVTEPMPSAHPNFVITNTTADGNYIPVDTMANAFGPAIGQLNPLAFDPYSGTVAFVHRGKSTYAAGSGELWYNYSTDFGVTWKRVPAGINTSAPQIYARYPSMAISNGTKGNLSATTALFSWPELTSSGSGFQQLGYGADQPLAAGACASFIDPGTPNAYTSAAVCWASDNSNWMYWTGEWSTGAGTDLFRTTDFGSILKTSPDTWNDSVFASGGSNGLGGACVNGVSYYAVEGTFNDWYYATPGYGHFASGWGVGYTKSTDNGVTWSTYKVCDFRRIPKLAKYDRLFDYKKGDAYVSYQGDMNVDKNGKVHLLVQLSDTISTEVDAEDALVDLYEDATQPSGWNATIVTKDLDVTGNVWLLGPGLGQMGPSSYLAFDKARGVMAAQWINTGAGGWADVFISYKKLTDTAWSTPVNLTNSATINNTQAHLAPMLRTNGSEFSAFSMYGYVAGNNLPYGDTTQPTVAYCGVYKFTVTGVNDKSQTVSSFELSQNYPNPFNPSTTVNFSVPERTNVSLKVYDMLGREVANLVNGTKEAGSYSVDFNASKLASGLYIYTLKAGSSSMSKKMMLMK